MIVAILVVLYILFCFFIWTLCRMAAIADRQAERDLLAWKREQEKLAAQKEYMEHDA